MKPLPKIENPTSVIFEQKHFMDGSGRELTRFVHHGGQLPKNFPKIQWRGFGVGEVKGERVRFEYWIRNIKGVEGAFDAMVQAATDELARLKAESGEVEKSEITEILKLRKDGSTEKVWGKDKGNNGTNRIGGK